LRQQNINSRFEERRIDQEEFLNMSRSDEDVDADEPLPDGSPKLYIHLNGMTPGMDSSGAGQQQIGANMFSGMSDQGLQRV
jgi:hypothetical protein